MKDDLVGILALGPCYNGRRWLMENAYKSTYNLWRGCQHGDWLLWLAVRLKLDCKVIALAACDCAEAALKYVPEHEHRPRVAIETTRNWCVGEATLGQVRNAAAAADAASADAYASAADAYASAAAAAADAASDRTASLAYSAKLVRKRIPWEIWKKAIRSKLMEGE